MVIRTIGILGILCVVGMISAISLSVGEVSLGDDLVVVIMMQRIAYRDLEGIVDIFYIGSMVPVINIDLL